MNKFLWAWVLLSPAALWAHEPAMPAGLPVGTPTPADSARTDSATTLQEIMVYGNQKKEFQMQSSVNRILVDRGYLSTHFAGSLMQTLSGIPGIKAMSIGSGQSKPAIRGLGFNRMVVAEDGIKHEGQQWGDDHGLEVDQFAIDRIEVIKGPGALLYGSDAIGGVLSLYGNYVPTAPLQGSASLFTRTNNASLGTSVRLQGRSNRLYWRTHLTAISYADYQVPTDSIEYYSYRIGLHRRRLRNTAGRELDGSVTLGYVGRRVSTSLKISDSFAKSGFFANAHGLEVRLSDIDYDRSARDIDLPRQQVNHLKVGSHTVWQLERTTLEANLAYQNNRRREYSEPVSHGYMPRPKGTLERQFDKHTLTANLGMCLRQSERNELHAGLCTEYQHNRRSGWGFIIPDFETASAGAYVLNRLTLSPHLILNAGLRYDRARTRIHSYRDWYLTPTGPTDSVYKERSAEVNRSFGSLTWSAGVNYAHGGWVLKANAGKSFRTPIPKELGADGVNYHIFRYEQGNTELRPEVSYQLDAGISWSNQAVSVELDPYLNYFPNYIYMNPTAGYYEGLQMYHYTQSRVLRYGFELQATWHIVPALEAEAKGEYLYARQQSGEKKGFTLPFSTPWSADATATYRFCRREGREGYASLNLHVVGAQHQIVPPEKPTPGYYTLNLTAGKTFALGEDRSLRLSLNADNLLNRRYYDHTSYYRLIDVPEPGRNMALMATLNF